MRRQRSLSAAGDRDHPARETVQGAARELKLATPLAPFPASGEGAGGIRGGVAETLSMAEETHRSRLGRGLAALIGDAGAEPAVERGGRAQAAGAGRSPSTRPPPPPR